MDLDYFSALPFKYGLSPVYVWILYLYVHRHGGYRRWTSRSFVKHSRSSFLSLSI